MKMICTFFFFGLITFSQTGKMYLSYQIGQGYWGDGGVCPERGVYDSPKSTVQYMKSGLGWELWPRERPGTLTINPDQNVGRPVPLTQKPQGVRAGWTVGAFHELLLGHYF